MTAKNAYSIYDKKSFSFSEPFFAVTDQQAVSVVAPAVFDVGTRLHRNPEDYSIYWVGEFDPVTGRLGLPDGAIAVREVLPVARIIHGVNNVLQVAQSAEDERQLDLEEAVAKEVAE